MERFIKIKVFHLHFLFFLVIVGEYLSKTLAVTVIVSRDFYSCWFLLEMLAALSKKLFVLRTYKALKWRLK